MRIAVSWRLLFAALLMGVAAGCASSGERYQTTTLTENQAGAIARSASVAVTVAGDGKYIDKPYPGSGGMARSAMITALSRHADDVFEVLSFVPEQAAGAGALGQDADYIVYLMILHWEERATEWSGKPDQIEIEVRLLDGRDGTLLASRNVKANSSWVTLGGDHPQDLLVKPFDDYAAELFGVARSATEAAARPARPPRSSLLGAPPRSMVSDSRAASLPAG
jgi:hypothetical protein